MCNDFHILNFVVSRKIGPQEFHAGNRVHLSSYKRGINEGAPFIDPWRNPYMMRGVPRDQAEMSRPVNEVSQCLLPFHKAQETSGDVDGIEHLRLPVRFAL